MHTASARNLAQIWASIARAHAREAGRYLALGPDYRDLYQISHTRARCYIRCLRDLTSRIDG